MRAGPGFSFLCSLNRGGRERLRRIFRLMETGKVNPTLMTTHEFSSRWCEMKRWKGER
jgi:hypothetical protein